VRRRWRETRGGACEAARERRPQPHSVPAAAAAAAEPAKGKRRRKRKACSNKMTDQSNPNPKAQYNTRFN